MSETATRSPHRWRVLSLPQSPSDDKPVAVVLLQADRDACVRYYEALRVEGPPEYEGRTLAVTDGFGLPVYAS